MTFRTAFFFALAFGLAGAQAQDLVHYAHTLQGTASDFGLSYGNTYPATALPFPMNAWSPQTGKDGDGWKYQYAADNIRAFGETHQCSPWVGDYGVFSLMPVPDSAETDAEKRATPFSHQNEIGEPGYYSVKLNNGIRVEMTPTERGCHMRLSFSGKAKARSAYVMLDGYTKLSDIHIDPDRHAITGWVNNGRWTLAGFRNYFVIVFDKPFLSYGSWENVHGSLSAGKKEDQGEGVGAFVQFAKGSVVEAKIASSYISPEQAEVTLQRELGGFASFDATHRAADEVWNTLFKRVLVEGGTEDQKATFYSCLFRASLFSHTFFEYDKDGNPCYYSPYDGHIHTGYMYTDNGFWDTFRSQFPLTDILHPTLQGRYMQALLAAQQQCGWLPAWSAPSETGGMLGNHAISLLTDAWAKGIHAFNPDSALKAYAHEAMNKGPWGGANGRIFWKEYWELGYVPYPESQGSTAQTQEYAYDDFCGYNLARMTGNTFYEQIFARSMYNYRNVFDTLTGFMRGRQANGQWTPDFDPLAWGGPYTEGNAWHYNWSVFHDVQGLINLMGGEAKFVAKMDSVFTLPNKVVYGTYGGMIHEMKEMVIENMGQYAQGNQPIQHMIYLYSYAGQPWKTQQHIREVMDKLYNATEKGYPGDEDQGGMSSWYVLSAMGIYAVCPGTDQYVLGSPVFNKVTLTLENGRQFIIEAANNSKTNVYIQSATLNGKPYTHNWITYQDIVSGGILHLDMSAQPNEHRGIAPEDKPFSVSTSQAAAEVGAAVVGGTAVAVASPAASHTPLTLASPLQSNMVIQQNKPFTIWGHATPGDAVRVAADWLPGPVTVNADTAGAFSAIVAVPAANRGDYREHSLTVACGSELTTLSHLLIGEVWLCSGQSNMQFSMATVLDSTADIAAAHYPNIRLFNAALNFSDQPIDGIGGTWVECSPKTVRGFSAVGYYFGHRLQQALDVPVGIIFSGIGASAAQAFVPRTVLATDTLLDHRYLEPYLQSPRSHEHIDGGFTFEKVTRPYLLYNAMINPLRHLSVRGFCWYQGESNRTERDSYTLLTQTLIRSWRQAFAQGDLPFYYVQVAPFFYDQPDSTLADYAYFREAQEKIATLPNTGMVITMDVGESRNLHPINKKPVGERLAAMALNREYGLTDKVYRGPQYRCMEIKDREAIIHFEPETVNGGLRTSDGKAPAFFTMAGGDHVFYPADASIEGDEIIVHCDKVKNPVAVRYAFTNFPVTNLENGACWPVVPFRTDNWPEK